MEPKSDFNQVIQDLELDVTIYLEAIYDYQDADEGGRKMIEMQGLPEMPPYLLLYRKMKTWNNNGLPFLWEGAYMDQPYVSTRLLETVDYTVKRVEANYDRTKRAKEKVS